MHEPHNTFGFFTPRFPLSRLRIQEIQCISFTQLISMVTIFANHFHPLSSVRFFSLSTSLSLIFISKNKVFSGSIESFHSFSDVLESKRSGNDDFFFAQRGIVFKVSQNNSRKNRKLLLKVVNQNPCLHHIFCFRSFGGCDFFDQQQ